MATLAKVISSACMSSRDRFKPTLCVAQQTVTSPFQRMGYLWWPWYYRRRCWRGCGRWGRSRRWRRGRRGCWRWGRSRCFGTSTN